MNFKRIIPCLDLYNGRIIKGVKFKNLIDIGDPLSVTSYYCDEGADEITILDISAGIENKNQTYNLINKVSMQINIPITVGGGIKSYCDFKNLFNSGADKISLNSHIIDNFNFIKNIKFLYGSQCIISAIDVKKIFFNKFFYFWNVYKKSGKLDSNFNLKDLIIKFSNMGIGEFIITSIDRDGTKSGFDLELLSKISNIINTNITASGGGGDLNSILNIFKLKNINSVLLASVLHNKIYSIFSIKNYLFNNGVLVRF
ncbi:MAG: imidazole glycerol phosphate synthase subunit HisF [Candidatus Nasuia deltocephalinicola]